MLRCTLFVLLIAALSGHTASAQQKQVPAAADKPLRIEITARSVNETYRILPFGEHGLVLFFRSQEIADESKTKWYFSLYDTNLQQVWVRSVPLFNDVDFRYSQTDHDTLSLLFLHTGKSRGPENDFEVLRLLPTKAALVLNTGKIQQDAEVTAFGIRRGRAWLGYNVKGQSGKIMDMRLDNGLIHAFQLGQGSLITVRWMQPDSGSSTVLSVVSRQVSKKTLEHYLVRYDTLGNIRSEIPIGTRDDGRNLTNVRMTVTEPGSALVMGCYGQAGGSSGQKDKVAEETTGFFTSFITGGAQKEIGYFNFLELKNAAALISERDIMNLKKKALKKNKTLSEYSLDYMVLLHPVFAWNDQYVLIAEAFTPQYHTESFTDFDYYGRPYTNSFSVFDGYRFFNTIIAGCDKTGKMLWDNTFEMRNLVSFDLSEKVVAFRTGQDLVLCYVSDGKIGSKIIREGTVVEKAGFGEIDLMYPDDKLLTESKGRIVHWYGKFFLTSGYQEIKNIALDSDNKRLVFYFSKICFEN